MDSNQPQMLDLNNILGASKALFEHDQITMNSNKKPVNTGVTDDYSEVRLRLAQIDNYLIERNGKKIDPLKVDNVINMNTGKVTIRWIDYNGGVVRPERFGYPSEGYMEDWKYFPEKDSKYPEKRTLDCYNHDKASDKEMLDLTHAFIWNNGSNWCGMNYLPPIGSIVVVGFKKGGLPIILGYVQSDYASCTPFLKPGETVIKGYGDNYIHWRLSNKLDINVKSKKGDKDLDDPYEKDVYDNSIEMWMRFDCKTRNIIIDVNQTDPGDKKRTTIEIKPENFKLTTKDLDGNSTSSFNLSTKDIYGNVNGVGKIYIGNNETSLSNGGGQIKINGSNIDITTGGQLNINASSLNLTSSGSTNINTQGLNIEAGSGITANGSQIILDASGGMNINGSNINLNSGSNIILNAPGSVEGSAGRYNLN